MLSFNPSIWPVGIDIRYCPNSIVKNNIIYNQVFKAVLLEGTTYSGLDIGNNCAYNTDGSIPGGTPFTNDLWGINPQFTDPAHDNYHLKSNSPCINAGATVSDVRDDYDNNARPSGTAYDIGAFEYQGGTAPAITTQPQSQTIQSGQATALNVSAAGTEPITYQWYTGTSGYTSNPVSGATSNSYTTPALTQRTDYWARVSNSFGNTDSNTATISVLLPKFTISGNIKTSAGQAVQGVSLTFSGIQGTVTTDANGFYSLDVTSGWSGTVTPTLTSYTFSPSSRSFTNVTAAQSGQDFTRLNNPVISGEVKTSAGTAVEGVTVTFSNSDGTATSDANGRYTKTVSYGWSGTATPTKTKYAFSPSNRSYSNLTADQSAENYTATPPPTISGTVKTAAGQAVQGVTLTPSGGLASVTTDAKGNYSFEVAPGWSGTVTPTLANFTLSPSNKSYTNVTAAQSGQDFTRLNNPVISGEIKTSAGTAVEGVRVTFSNNGGPATTDANGRYSITVSYGWGGTATPAKIKYTFSPSNRSYSNLTADQSAENYTATPPPIISGTIKTAAGEGVQGVTLTPSGGLASLTSDANGNYSFEVAAGWTGTVTPSKTKFTFSPSNRSYSNLTADQSAENYTAIPPPIILGTVKTAAGQGVQGVTMTFSGGKGSVTTDANGNYSFEVTLGWTGTVTPSLANITFSPSNRSYANITANQTAQDFTRLNNPVISGEIKTDSGTAVEGVTLTFSNGAETATTDANGRYSLMVSNGWSGTATPTKTAYTFTPASRSYSNLTSDQAAEHYSAKIIMITLAGSVKTTGGQGIPGVALTLSDGQTLATTDANGAYSFQVISGSSGTVTPAKTGYIFAPSSRSYANVSAGLSSENYAGALLLIMAGNIKTSTGQGIQGVTLAPSDGQGNATTDANGNYVLTLPSGWSGTITPTLANLAFSPANRSYSNIAANQSSQDYLRQNNPVIYGEIKTSAGIPLAGVTLVFSNGGGSTTTDANGRYSLMVNAGWSGTATPAKANFSFTPSNRSYSNVSADKSGENFAAISTLVTISGSVRTPAGNGVQSVTLTLSNVQGSVTTDAAGNYTYQVPAGWSGFATPAKANFSFTPSNRSYSNVSADKAGENFAAISTLVTISGSVRTPAGDGIQGITMTLSNGQGSVTTDAGGNFTRQIPAGWSGTITPNPGDTPFSPSSRSITNTVNQMGLDFTRLDTPTISGQVKTSDGLPVEGVKMIFSNGGGTTMTDADGNYALTVRYGWNGVATPAKVGFVFTPTRHIYWNVTLDKAGENFAGKSLVMIRHK